MEPMVVLTVKRDGGTQDVVGFYHSQNLAGALGAAYAFLQNSTDSRRAIARVEYYNPKAKEPVKEQ